MNPVDAVSPHSILRLQSDCLERLMREGLSPKSMRAVLDDSATCRRLISYWQAQTYPGGVSVRTAMDVMGPNYFGIENAITYFGVNPTNEQLSFMEMVPWSLSKLESVRKTHVLVAVFPMSILDLRKAIGEKAFDSGFGSYCGYQDQEFAKRGFKVGWRLLPKVSTSKLSGWCPPPVSILAYCTLGYALVSGERLFEGKNLRCMERWSEGFDVCVRFWNGALAAVSIYSLPPDSVEFVLVE